MWVRTCVGQAWCWGEWTHGDGTPSAASYEHWVLETAQGLHLDSRQGSSVASDSKRGRFREPPPGPLSEPDGGGSGFMSGILGGGRGVINGCEVGWW